ncbi:MAG: DUF3857 domain-containing protein [Calditrichaeota bacterium]|nr:MAG: DUF3857 domain-containing protein [Calditrichota bacterium]
MTSQKKFIHWCLLIVFPLLICSQISFAGLKTKWGKVDKKYLRMTAFAPDTNAAAVKIFDIGDLEIVVSRRFELYFERHYQIKILKDAGKKYADIAIPYWHKDKIVSLKAHTILPSGKKHKVKKKQIFDEEKKGNFRVKKVTFPQVVPGAIIEIRYKLHSDYITNLEPWVFHDEIPVLESRVELKMLPGFTYNVKVGNDPYHLVKKSEEQYSTISSGKPSITKKFVYTAKDLPALKYEPYISTMENYRARVDFLILSYRDPYTNYEFAKDRQTLVNELLEGTHKNFLKPTNEVKDLVADIIGDEPVRRIQIKLIFEYARDNFDEEMSYSAGAYVRRNQKDVIKDKKATNSERNMFMLSMLRAAGFKAEPLLISTWENGWIDPVFPFLTQFNRSIVAIKMGSRFQFLDASKKLGTMHNLPAEDLTFRGLLLKKDAAKIVRIPNKGIKSMETVHSVVDLNSDGSLSGKTTLTSVGYAAFNRSIELQKEKAVSDFITEQISGDIEGFEVLECDSLLKPVPSDTLETQFQFKTGEVAEIIDDEIYLQPLLYFVQNENLFKSEKRYFPVEFGYLAKWVELNSINLPTNFEVLELPEAAMVNCEFFTYRYTIMKTPGNERQLTATRFLKLKKEFIPASDYHRLRNYWSRIVDGDQQKLILQKLPN